MKKLIILCTACIALLSVTMFSCEDDPEVTCMDDVWYRDMDGDGKGDKLHYLYSCNVQPAGFVADNTDHDDNLPCPEALVFYADKDGDGLGDPNDPIFACEAPEGYVENNDDNADFPPIEYNPVPVPDPLFAFHFDENGGNTVANTGTLSGTVSELGKTNPPVWSMNIPRSGGTSSVDFGAQFDNYYVESASIIGELTGLEKLTVTGWVNNKLAETGSGGNRIVSWINNGGDGFDLVYNADGSIKVGINQWPDGSEALSTSGKITTSETGGVSNWVFFAVTYDATVPSLTFYFGDNSTVASEDKSYAYDAGAIAPDIGKLSIGHFNEESRRTSRTDRMFRGLIDEVEIFHSVLTLDQIITVQNE